MRPCAPRSTRSAPLILPALTEPPPLTLAFGAATAAVVPEPSEPCAPLPEPARSPMPPPPGFTTPPPPPIFRPPGPVAPTPSDDFAIASSWPVGTFESLSTPAVAGPEFDRTPIVAASICASLSRSAAPCAFDIVAPPLPGAFDFGPPPGVAFAVLGLSAGLSAGLSSSVVFFSSTGGGGGRRLMLSTSPATSASSGSTLSDQSE